MELKLEKIDENHKVYTSQDYSFTTDTLLLAHFSSPGKNEICADFGTGCGMIAFLWKVRQRPKYIYGIDIQKNAVAQSKKTQEYNSFSDMEFINGDIRDTRKLLPHQGLDLIACNPPYKAQGSGLKSSRDSRAIAWNEGKMTMKDLASASAYALKHGGRLCICQRTERLAEIIRLLSEMKLEPKRLRFVQQTAESNPKLFLMETRLGGKTGLVTESALIMKEEGSYTEEMKNIYGDYYSGK